MLLCECCSTKGLALGALRSGLNCADYGIAVGLAKLRYSGSARSGPPVAAASAPTAEAAPVQQAQNQESGANRADCSSARDSHSRIDLHLDKDCVLFQASAAAERFRRGMCRLVTCKPILRPQLKAIGIPGLMRKSFGDWLELAPVTCCHSRPWWIKGLAWKESSSAGRSRS